MIVSVRRFIIGGGDVMPKICETCKNTIPIEHGLYCQDCRRIKTIEAHQEHLAFCSDYIAGKYGPIDEDEFIAAENEIARVRNELEKIGEFGETRNA